MLQNFILGNKPSISLVCLLLLAFFPVAVFSQSTTDHAASILAFSRGEMEKLIADESGSMAGLLHGRRFQAQYPFVRGTPFWFHGVWLKGDAHTAQYIYRNLPLQYDAYKDALVFFPDSFSLDMIALNPIQILAFEIEGSVFVFLGRGDEKETMEKIRLLPGYFELYYEGQTLLLAKRSKVLLKVSDNPEITGRFVARTTWYIVKEGVFYPAEKNRDILALFPSHKEVVKAYWRRYQIRNWRNNPDLLAEFLRYCDQL